MNPGRPGWRAAGGEEAGRAVGTARGSGPTRVRTQASQVCQEQEGSQARDSDKQRTRLPAFSHGGCGAVLRGGVWAGKGWGGTRALRWGPEGSSRAAPSPAGPTDS